MCRVNRVRPVPPWPYTEAMSMATLSNWGTNALSAHLFPWYVATLGMHVGFFTFAGICLIATVFFWRFVPETKVKSLEDMKTVDRE